MAGHKKQLFEKIAAFPGLKECEYSEVAGERFRFYLNVQLDYCGRTASFGAKGRRTQTKKEAEESAAMQLLKNTEFLCILDYRNWSAPMDLADLHPVSALHETLAQNKLPYTAKFCTSGSTTFSSVAMLQPCQASSACAVLEVTGHKFSNKKWAERSAAFAMLKDARFQALVNQRQAPCSVPTPVCHPPGLQGLGDTADGDGEVRCGACSAFLSELSHVFFYHRGTGDVLLAMKPEILAALLHSPRDEGWNLPQVSLPPSAVAAGFDLCGFEAGNICCCACKGVVGKMHHSVASLNVYAVVVGGQRFSPFRGDTWESLCSQATFAQVEHRGDGDYFGSAAQCSGSAGVGFAAVKVKSEVFDPCMAPYLPGYATGVAAEVECLTLSSQMEEANNAGGDTTDMILDTPCTAAAVRDEDAAMETASAPATDYDGFELDDFLQLFEDPGLEGVTAEPIAGSVDPSVFL